MGDWPSPETSYLSSRDWVSTLQEPAMIVAATSTAWPAANRALFMPVVVPAPATVYKMVVGCGATGGGNFDVGLYTQDGVLLVSSGSTARSATNEVVANVTDTYIGAGQYYLALVVDGTNNMWQVIPTGSSPIPVNKARMAGLLQMDTAFALPATATFATPAAANIPHIVAYLRPN